MAAGRPSEYDYALCLEICDRIADGKHVVEVLNADDRFPVWSTFRVWKRDHEELQTLYTRSIQDKAEMVTLEINQIMQEMKDGTVDAPIGRVLIDTLKWFASKYYPRMFGERVDVSGTILNSAPLSIDEIRQAKTNLENEL